MLMTGLVRRGAVYYGPRTAVMYGNDKLTFAQVDQLSNQIANVFSTRWGSRSALASGFC
jgi:hypothetical protein